MSLRRTARGKMLDMAALVTKNETMRAVSNQRLNARGDVVDSSNKVVVKATEKVNKAYSKTVGNKAAQPRSAASRVKVANVAPPAPDFSELNELEKEFEIEDQEIDIEELKEINTGNKKSNG